MKRITAKPTKKKAFTLVEVLIVITIIGILTTIAIPEFLQAKEESEQASADAIAKTLNEGIKRAELDDNTDPVLEGSNAEAAAAYLLDQGYVTKYGQ